MFVPLRLAPSGLACLAVVLLPAGAMAWTARPSLGAPDLHTTTLAIDLRPEGPAPGGLVVDLTCMDEGVWRARVSLGAWPQEPVALRARDFRCIKVGKTREPLRFAYAKEICIGGDGGSGDAAPEVAVRWPDRD